jgi:hypothetical protein
MIEKLFADFNSTVVPGQQLAQLEAIRKQSLVKK